MDSHKQHLKFPRLPYLNPCLKLRKKLCKKLRKKLRKLLRQFHQLFQLLHHKLSRSLYCQLLQSLPPLPYSSCSNCSSYTYIHY